MLEEFKPKLQQDLGLKESLGNAADGVFSLRLDDTTISAAESGSGFELFATLGELPSELPELFFIKLLRANLFGQATFGATLGLDESGTRVMARMVHSKKPSYRDFKERLEDFINLSDFWKSEIELHKKAPNQQ